jgi:hypothetical protein
MSLKIELECKQGNRIKLTNGLDYGFPCQINNLQGHIERNDLDVRQLKYLMKAKIKF